MRLYLKEIIGSFIGLLFMGMFTACLQSAEFSKPPGYNNEDTTNVFDVDTTENRIDLSKYKEARSFPGLVGSNVPRVTDYEVTLNTDYPKIENVSRFALAPQPQFTTGLYAAPGETITIDVPDGITEKLFVQIGIWTDVLPDNNSKRASKITVLKALHPGENQLSNPYGGPVYILLTDPTANPLTLTFSGAVKIPVFKLGKTAPAEWWSNINDNKVPWIELKSENIIMTLPREKFLQKQIMNPTSIVQFWNDVIEEDYYEWLGLEKNATDPLNAMPVLPYRIALDTLLSGAVNSHNGYPIMEVMDGGFNNLSDTTRLIKVMGNIQIFEYLGENLMTPKWVWQGVNKSIKHLYIFKVIRRLGLKNDILLMNNRYSGLSDIFGEGIGFASSSGNKSFDSHNNPLFKVLPFIQIFEKAKDGYDFMPYLSKKARQVNNSLRTTQEKHDFFYKTLCDYTKKDWKLFFKAWGIHINEMAKLDINQKGYPYMFKKLWTYNPITDTGGLDEYNPYNQTNWTVYGYSSEQDGNYAKLSIDGDDGTSWLSRWSDPRQTPPYSISFDMQMELPVKSIHIIQRSNWGYLGMKNIKIEISLDGNNWNDLNGGNLFTLNSGRDSKVNLASVKTFRYFKITVPSKNDLFNPSNLNTGLSEVWAEGP